MDQAFGVDLIYVVALEVVVIDEFTQRLAQRGFSEQDEFGQTHLIY